MIIKLKKKKEKKRNIISNGADEEEKNEGDSELAKPTLIEVRSREMRRDWPRRHGSLRERERERERESDRERRGVRVG